MEELLKNGLVTLTTEVYHIGFLLLSARLEILMGNSQVARWLDRPLNDYLGKEVTEAIPELVGSEALLIDLREGEEGFRLEQVFRPSADGLGNYFDIGVMRLADGTGELLLTTADVTRQALQEQLLQQQRNEVQLMSAQLTLANERLNYLLNRLVPKSVAEMMMSSRELPRPGGETIREATILFADMRDFTAVAEAYHPSDTLEFLNAYLAVVSEAVLRHDGALVQMVGDMIMGVFNLPTEQPDHAERAVRAAIDIQTSLASFAVQSDARFPAVSFGVGISTGNVISGYLGAQQRFRYAVVGDATNVAFHLSSLAAGGRILLSEPTADAVGHLFNILEKGDIQLKRRRRLVKVYEMSSMNPYRQPDPQSTS